MKGYSGIILIIVSIGLFFTVIDPVYKEVQSLENTKKENEVMINRARELREKRTELMNRYNAISPTQREQLNKVLPETIDNIRLINDINNIARRYGLTLSSFSLGGDVNQESDVRIVDRTGKDYGTIELSFSFISNYGTMKVFVSDLEQSLRLIDIREINVSAGGEDDNYTYTLKLDTYWLR